MKTSIAATASLSLAGRITHGDAQAEEQLVREFGSRVLSMMTARVRDRESARDLAQETLLAVILALRKNQLHHCEKLAAFVYGIARNVLNNYFRASGKVPRSEELPADDHILARQLMVLPDSPGNLDVARAALERMDRSDREILTMILVEGLKPGEIAVRLSITPEAARARKSRAIKRIVELAGKPSRPGSF